jgi:XTP/dITP diphosphohydrolase
VITLVLATNNRDKVAELAHGLHGLPLRVKSVGELGDWPEVEESGETLQANALLKVRAALERTGMPSLADDTGLEVDALGGAPGVRSSRYAGEDVTYAENVARLLREMEEVGEERRTARFRCVIALADPDGRTGLVEGVVEGRILDAPRGTGGFGYDPVFFVPEAGKSYAEMDLAEKDRWSHRGRAMRAARRVIEDWYGR